MSLPVTKLDTIEFEALVEQARALIPRYAPTWTDHNLHDPGITLIELLAWIVDQEVFRIGFVGDRHHQAFAALLGERPRRAVPARGVLWPAAQKPGDASAPPRRGGTLLKKGMAVASVEQPDLSFLLERDLFLTDARMGSPQVVEDDRRITLAGLIANEPAPLSADRKLGIGARLIELPFDRPLVPELPASGGSQLVSLGIAVDRLIHLGEENAKAWGPIAFEYRVGERDWERVEIRYDGTLALARTGVVMLSIPSKGGEEKSALRLRLDRGFFPIAPKLRRITANILPVVQLQQTPERVLGRSNGLPDQTFEIDLEGLPEPDTGRGTQAVASTPAPSMIDPATSPSDNAQALTSRPLTIEVDGEAWRCVDDFKDSGPADHHYTVDIRRGRIAFGNGINGAIPARAAQISHFEFHVTKGAEGNLGGGRRWRIAGLSAAEFANPDAIAGGRDPTTIDELRARARARAIERRALLTNDELRAAAEKLPGFAVGRAEVLIRHDQSLPGREFPGTRTLVIVPDRDPAAAPEPVPQQYLDAVAEELSPRRVLGERLSIIGPEYVWVDIELDLIVAVGTDEDELDENIRNTLAARLSDLERDPAVAPWPLGRPVTRREIKALVAKLPGVAVVRACLLAKAGERPASQDLKLEPDAIALAGRIDARFEPELVGSA